MQKFPLTDYLRQMGQIPWVCPKLGGIMVLYICVWLTLEWSPPRTVLDLSQILTSSSKKSKADKDLFC